MLIHFQRRRWPSERTLSLLFLDNRLPDGYGLDFIPFVKKNYPACKVVMITAHDSSAERKTANAGGADLFLAKPLNREIINKALDSLMQN